MAIEITDEMRKAVREEECALKGHDFNLNTAFRQDETVTSGFRSKVGGPDDKLPHLSCTRCERVWLIIEAAAPYEEAETSLLGQLKTTTELAKDVRERKDRRGSA